ncbi:hypothetical protein [Pelagicoccus albus]|uniref:Uncharacterized protein n=1 Tax=Pelagicoccus albus TaxID=415222 RepID=A0A7X1E8B2_9BACT|nr:hypothetical protein [Pelagicoccus albus]MBC2604597.1 hypothetical protein [Pelagicoccus albus]
MKPEFLDKSEKLSSCFSEYRCGLECHGFRDFDELRAHLIERFPVSDVTVTLQADFAHSNSAETLDRIEITEISQDSVLLGISVGRRACLVVNLEKDSEWGDREGDWRPRQDYRGILTCAKWVYCRNVRDQVVEQMSNRGANRVVSFFLNSEGKIESASGLAKEFCESRFLGLDRANDYFPQSHWEYIQGALAKQKEVDGKAYKNDSLVFSFLEDSGIVNCVLQNMGETGFLLSLSAADS